MTDPIDTTGIMLGELKGQMREVVHTLNNMSMKLDGLSEKVISAQTLPAEVADLDRRVAILEIDKNRRDGAMGFGGWLINSPVIGWLVASGVGVWMLLKGKLG